MYLSRKDGKGGNKHIVQSADGALETNEGQRDRRMLEKWRSKT